MKRTMSLRGLALATGLLSAGACTAPITTQVSVTDPAPASLRVESIAILPLTVDPGLEQYGRDAGEAMYAALRDHDPAHHVDRGEVGAEARRARVAAIEVARIVFFVGIDENQIKLVLQLRNDHRCISGPVVDPFLQLRQRAFSEQTTVIDDADAIAAWAGSYTSPA